MPSDETPTVDDSHAAEVDFYASETFELFVRLSSVMAGIDVLGVFLDRRRERELLRGVVQLLEEHSSRDGAGRTDFTTGQQATEKILDSYWARACGELGEIARFAMEYDESAIMFRKALRVWNGFGEETQLELVSTLGYVAAHAGDETTCLGALAICEKMKGVSGAAGDLRAAARQLAATKFERDIVDEPVEQTVIRIRL